MNVEKINELKKWMLREKVDCAYISDPNHIAYLSGFSSDPHERVLALFLPLEKEPFLFVPALEIEEAKSSSWTGEVYGYLDNEHPWAIIKSILDQRFHGKLGTMAIEKGQLIVERLQVLQELLPNTTFSHNLTPILQKMQLLKTKEEIQKLYDAGRWADVAFETGFRFIQKGATEQEIIAEIEYELKKQGVSKMSFDTMVLSGDNAANPHGTPGLNQLQENQFVLFDLGVVWNGYNSDATRTVSFGEPRAFDKEIYALCLEAQLAAMDFVKPGVRACEIDAVARNIITQAGYGKYFNHRLGHGIGTTVHEYPSLVAGNDLIIEEGMCFSIEPGIYIPEKVGVRIEDCVHVTKEGCLPFTTTSKELLVIG